MQQRQQWEYVYAILWNVSEAPELLTQIGDSWYLAEVYPSGDFAIEFREEAEVSPSLVGFLGRVGRHGWELVALEQASLEDDPRVSTRTCIFKRATT